MFKQELSMFGFSWCRTSDRLSQSSTDIAGSCTVLYRMNPFYSLCGSMVSVQLCTDRPSFVDVTSWRNFDFVRCITVTCGWRINRNGTVLVSLAMPQHKYVTHPDNVIHLIIQVLSLHGSISNNHYNICMKSKDTFQRLEETTGCFFNFLDGSICTYIP